MLPIYRAGIGWTCLGALLLVSCSGGESETPSDGDDDDTTVTDTDTDTDLPTPDPGAGLALLFTGVDRVVGDSSPLPMGNDPRTVQAWVRTDVMDADQGFVEWGTFFLGSRDGRVVVDLGGDEILGPGIADGRWAHVAVSFDGTSAELFVNNASAGSLPVTLTTDASDLHVGDRLDGMMDEVRIYSAARTAADISADARQTLSGDEDQLVLYWTFDDLTTAGSGQPVRNHASATGAAGDGTTEGTGTSPTPLDSDAW